LPAPEITPQVEAAVIAALLWVARIHGVPDEDLLRIRAQVGSLPGALSPDEMTETEVAELLAMSESKKKRDPNAPPEALYRKVNDHLEFFETAAAGPSVVTLRGRVGEPARREA